MYSFIRELYFGNITPNAKQFDRNPNYAKALQRASDNEDKLTEMLSGEEKQLFLDYANACSEVLDESSTETFVDGFRIGAQFVFDTFVSTENVFSPIAEGTF